MNKVKIFGIVALILLVVLTPLPLLFGADWDIYDWLEWLPLSAFTAVAVAWMIVSYCNIVDPDEVAKLKWFGKLKKGRLTSSNGLFGSGLHFVPWFWGIRLIRISKKMLKHPFEKDQDPKVLGNVMSGSMFAVRSKNGQKLFVEATAFNRFAYDIDSMLDLLIEAGVPIDDPEDLGEYIEDAIAPDIEYIFGQFDYQDVMGGQQNRRLNYHINKRLQKDGSLLRRVGFFGNDHTDDTPGTGEFDLKIEFVHLSGKLGESIERVETAKLEAEAAKNTADKEAEETAGRIERSVNKLVTIGDTKEEAIKFAKKQVMLDRNNYQEEVKQILVGSPDGKPFDKDAVLGPIIGGIAAFFGLKGGSSSGGGGGKSGKRKRAPWNQGPNPGPNP